MCLLPHGRGAILVVGVHLPERRGHYRESCIGESFIKKSELWFNIRKEVLFVISTATTIVSCNDIAGEQLNP